MQEMKETLVWSLGQEDPLKEEIATHSSVLAWKIPWTEEPGRLQSLGSQRVRHIFYTGIHLCFDEWLTKWLCMWAIYKNNNLFINSRLVKHTVNLYYEIQCTHWKNKFNRHVARKDSLYITEKKGIEMPSLEALKSH